jgi:lysophospholipase L1-like esterase
MRESGRPGAVVRKQIFVIAAILLSTLAMSAVCAVAYLILQRPKMHALGGGFRQARFIRAYLFNRRVRRLADALQDADPRTDAFRTMWDTNAGVMLSRQMFREIEMDGVRKYAYQPSLHKLSFETGVGEVRWRMETIDTPAMREALAGLDTTFLTTASYDANGFRRVGPEFSSCRDHVLFLGDSFTDGLWVGDEETFANVYGKLARAGSAAGVCPVNAGVNGYGSFEERYVLEHDFDLAGKPSVVFVMYFPNDVEQDYDAVVHGKARDEDRLWQESLKELHQIHEFTAAHGSALVIAAIPPVEQVLEHVARTYYQDVLRTFAAREHVRFVDLYDGLAAGDPHSLYWSWDPHLTPAGHRAVAGLLYEATKDLLR